MAVTLQPIPVGPANAELVTGFISRCRSAGLDFCPSDPTTAEPYSLFFYHTPKTGGMRFIMPIAFAIESLAFSEGNELRSQLLESSLAPFPICSHSRGNQNFESALAWQGSFFYSDHQLPYGSHQELGRQPNSPKVKTATILRNPADRLNSALKYIWRISGKDISAVKTAINSRHPHIDNPITRIFSGRLDSTVLLQDSDADAALIALQEIDDCMHQENYSPVRRLQQDFVSKNRLPNLIIPSLINKTPTTPSRDDLNEMELLIGNTDCNQWDAMVYDRLIQEKPIDHEPSSFSINSLHPLTFLMISETQEDGGTFISPKSKLVLTIDLLLNKVVLPIASLEIGLALGA